MHPTLLDIIAAVLFALAVVHTFVAPAILRAAGRHPRHAGLLHLMGEVEVVFGLWAVVLVAAMAALDGGKAAVDYVEGRNFNEPLFVFAIMVVAASRPILDVMRGLVDAIAARVRGNEALARHFLALSFVPLMGSLITEPAAMTLAALMLRESFFAHATSTSARYATLGVLLVNVSIGGVLTAYAAPPVLMVSATWGWDTRFMLTTFGLRAAVAVLVNAAVCTFVFRAGIAASAGRAAARDPGVPAIVRVVHLAFLAAIVAFAHHAVVFLAIFLFFLGFTQAYERYQDRLMLREALLVGFFLAGLVAIGAPQRWWLQDLLSSLPPAAVFWGALGLTAIADNAALTYFGSLVENVSEGFKYSLVAGAVAGGGLTVIANAPNPAGLALLRPTFQDGAVSALALAAGAALPTLVAAAAFLL